MKLVIGGAYQGKRGFLMQKWDIREGEIADMTWNIETDEETASDAATDTANLYENESLSMCAFADSGIRAIVNYQDLIREQMEKGLDPAGELRQLVRLNPEIILCADEIGMGIVPMDRKERDSLIQLYGDGNAELLLHCNGNKSGLQNSCTVSDDNFHK